jgi:DNA primase
VIDRAKQLVPVLDLADRLAGAGGLRRVGREWVGRCVLPDHEDRVPSFTVNPERNLFYCHGCARGGDVVTLAALAWGHDRADVAAAEVLLAFGHEVPPRPSSWHAKQERQKPIRDGIEEALVHVARQRLYRRYFEPVILATVDEEERKHDEQALWEATLPLAEHLVTNMMGGGR